MSSGSEIPDAMQIYANCFVSPKYVRVAVSYLPWSHSDMDWGATRVYKPLLTFFLVAISRYLTVHLRHTASRQIHYSHHLWIISWLNSSFLLDEWVFSNSTGPHSSRPDTHSWSHIMTTQHAWEFGWIWVIQSPFVLTRIVADLDGNAQVSSNPRKIWVSKIWTILRTQMNSWTYPTYSMLLHGIPRLRHIWSWTSPSSHLEVRHYKLYSI